MAVRAARCAPLYASCAHVIKMMRMIMQTWSKSEARDNQKIRRGWNTHGLPSIGLPTPCLKRGAKRPDKRSVWCLLLLLCAALSFTALPRGGEMRESCVEMLQNPRHCFWENIKHPVSSGFNRKMSDLKWKPSTGVVLSVSAHMPVSGVTHMQSWVLCALQRLWQRWE